MVEQWSRVYVSAIQAHIASRRRRVFNQEPQSLAAMSLILALGPEVGARGGCIGSPSLGANV